MSVFFKPVTASPMDRVPMEGLAATVGDYSATADKIKSQWNASSWADWPATVYAGAVGTFTILAKNMIRRLKGDAAAINVQAGLDRLAKRLDSSLTPDEKKHVLSYLTGLPSRPDIVAQAWAKVPSEDRTTWQQIVVTLAGQIPVLGAAWQDEMIRQYAASFPGGGGKDFSKAADESGKKEHDAGECADHDWWCKAKNAAPWFGAALGGIVLIALAWRFMPQRVTVVGGSKDGVKGLPRGGKKRKAKRAKK